MSFRTAKLKWAKRLLRAKYFVVLTNDAAIIALDGADPDKLDDFLVLRAQTSELIEFHTELGALIERHQAAVEKKLEATREKLPTARAKKPSAKKTVARKSTKK